MAKIIAAVSVSIAVTAVAAFGIVRMNAKASIARSEAVKAESEEAAAKKAAQKAELEASQARSRAAAKASEAKAVLRRRRHSGRMRAMTPEQALEYGLIDRIYTTRKEITDGR